jgi:hypothetical protein
VINSVKLEEFGEKDDDRKGMYLKFSSYNMNIIAAHKIDSFLYCLCKSHMKIIDRVPIGHCESGVYIYGISQMKK